MKKIIILFFTVLFTKYLYSNEYGWERILSANSIISSSDNYQLSPEHRFFMLKYNRKFFKYYPHLNSFESAYRGMFNDTYFSGSVGGNPFSGYHYVTDSDVSGMDTNFIIYTKFVGIPIYNPFHYKVFVSFDGGLNIGSTDYGFYNVPFKGIKISNQNDSIVYIVIGRNLYRSIDRGNTISIYNNSEIFTNWININRYNNEIMYANNDFNNLYVSTNSGISFTLTTLPYFTKFIYNTKDSTIYGIFDNFIYRSIDGINWNSYSTLQNVQCLEFHHTDNAKIFAGNPQGLFESTDNGLTWTLYNNTFSPSRRVNNIFSDPVFADTLIVCTEEAVYKVFDSYVVNITALGSNIPTEFTLYQNYPNPFNPVTNIKFSLPNTQYTILKIFDITGREIATLVNEVLQAGEYNYEFRMTNYELSSGIYFYQLRAGNPSTSSEQGFIQTRKMVLTK